MSTRAAQIYKYAAVMGAAFHTAREVSYKQRRRARRKPVVLDYSQRHQYVLKFIFNR